MPGSDLLLRLALYAGVVAFTGWHLGRLEQDALPQGDILALALLALAPALVGRVAGFRAGLLALAGAVVAGLGVATGHWPSRPLFLADGDRHAYLPDLGNRLWTGVEGWFGTTLPFDADRYPGLRALSLAVAFVTLLLVARWLVERPRPVLTVLAALIPFAVVSIVFRLPDVTLRAALFLAFALAVLALGDRRPDPGVPLRPSHPVVAGGVVMALALLLVAVPGVSRGAALPWREWRLLQDQKPVGVSYVWNHSYKPLSWPKERTEVLRVTADKASYWRAVVLDDFDGVSWRRSLDDDVRAVADGSVVQVPPADGVISLSDQANAEIEVRGLAEPYLLAPGQPLRYEVPRRTNGGALSSAGVVELLRAPRKGTTYEVRSLISDPTDTELRAALESSQPDERYPPSVRRTGLRPFFNDVPVPAFGTPDREGEMALLFEEWDNDPERDGWREAYEKTRTITQGTTSPLEAVRRIEIYFRSQYRYDEKASLDTEGGPPLPGFILNGDRGYCQMFSGSMATMLRLLGIPARVAEGFTAGEKADDGTYRVTDRNAHAWVEVYFPTYGWLPFDPTPTRGLGTRASASSATFGGGTTAYGEIASLVSRYLDDAGAGAGSAEANRDSEALNDAREERRFGLGPGLIGVQGRQDPGTPWLMYLLAGLGGVLALVLLLKAAARAWTLRARDPRGRAAGYRQDLAAYALDQKVVLGPALTHREFADRLAGEFGVDATGWASTAERVRFAPPERSATAVRELRFATKKLRHDIRRTLGPRDRAAGALSLRSVAARVPGFRTRA